ncbi:MAG: four helix bundle protein [Bacteroidetes bacterium]|nr:four helix bundle protein [Bacteroidia bacterium]PCH67733.1 MAG: four helix bundle protein [Bacteroidota bacterium]
MKEKKYDIEERLIDFAVEVVCFFENLPNSKSATHLGGQLLRSGTSPALNYGEAKSAESRNDFLHKMKVCLKELRESYNCLRIMKRTNLYKAEVKVDEIIIECNELISIFVKSIATVSKHK